MRSTRSSGCAIFLIRNTPVRVAVGGRATKSRKNSFPAKAGIHLSADRVVDEWIPAFAGNAKRRGQIGWPLACEELTVKAHPSGPATSNESWMRPRRIGDGDSPFRA